MTSLAREVIAACLASAPAGVTTDPTKTLELAPQRHADGLGMLLQQAVRPFSLWFGMRPEVTPEPGALVEADLARW